MKTATRAYKSQMKKLLRNHSYVGVAFGNVDVTAGKDGDWQGSQTSTSRIETLDYNHVYPFSDATLEMNRWTLDGRSVISADGNYGFIGNTLSDSDGNVSYEMERSFSRTHAISGITITFDGVNGEFPTEFGVDFYEGNDVTHIDVFPTSSTIPVSYASDSVTGVVINFAEMLPYRRPRVQTTIWGVGYSYENADLLSLGQTNDVDPLSRRLPSEKFTFTIHDYEHKFDPENPQGVYATINKGAPISVSYGYELDDGTVEWLQADNYVLENKPTFRNSQVTFNGSGLLSTMTGLYYRGVLGTKSFYDMAVDVLEDADLTPTPSGEDPWDIDVSLQTMYTDAPMPIQTHAQCLQMIAHACNCRLFTDDQNIIHIEPFGVTPAGVFSGAFSDNGHAWISSWDSVDYGSESGTTYVTLELNRWVLGTPQSIADENPAPNGYVSMNMSGEDLSLADTTWSKRFDVIHDIPSLVITFDDFLDEYPGEMSVAYYDRDGALIGTMTVEPDDVTYTISTNYEDCSYFIVTMSRMRIPYRRARVTRAAYFETDFSLTLDSVIQDTLSTTKLDRLRNMTVAVYSYLPGTAVTEYSPSVDINSMSGTTTPAYRASKLYETETTETSLHAEFQTATDITITVEGGSVLSSEVFAQAVDLTLSSGSKKILIEGVPVNEGSVVYTYNFNSSGEDDIEENKLITNKTMADAHAAHVGAYLELRNTYDASYRGNPEVETGDIISLQTAYDNVVYGLVLTDEISFDGTLNGKMKVKGLV